MKYINLEYHPSDSRVRIVDDDVSQTLSSRMGTGGGNVPIILLVLEDQGGVSSDGITTSYPQQSERKIMDILR